MSNHHRHALAPAADADGDPDSVDHNSGYDEASEDDDRGSVFSYVSGNAPACNNWRGWRCAQTTSCNAAALHHQQQQVNADSNTADGVSILRRYHMHQAAAATHAVMTHSLTTGFSSSRVLPLRELSARSVASYLPFEMVDYYNIKVAPVPEELQRKIAFWSFPENEEDIRLYSTLANGSPDHFITGENIAKTPDTVRDMLQIGFHLTAAVCPTPTAAAPISAGNGVAAPLPNQRRSDLDRFDVCMTFDRKRITTCSCTCNSQWCEHIVAVCLARVRCADKLVLRAPISESLYRLDRTQLHKAFQYFVNELPRHVLPHAQRVLDQLLTPHSTINLTHGAPDPTAGSSASDVSSWWYELNRTRNSVRSLLLKFCLPAPQVYSDVAYLSASQSTAAAEWSSLMRPLRGREPEGLWNLLGIVREMLRRGDNNATSLLRAITDECMNHVQVPIWWFNIRTSNHYGGSGSQTRAAGPSGAVINANSSSSASAATNHACASLMDEIVNIWRLVALNPTFTDEERLQILQELCSAHDKIFELVTSARQQHAPNPAVNNNEIVSATLKPIDINVFVGFRWAIEAALVDWHGFSLCDNKLIYFSLPLSINTTRSYVGKHDGILAAQPAARSGEPGDGVAATGEYKQRTLKSRGKSAERVRNRLGKRAGTGKIRLENVADRRRRSFCCGDGDVRLPAEIVPVKSSRLRKPFLLTDDKEQSFAEDVHKEIVEIGDAMKLPKKHVCAHRHGSKRRGGKNRRVARELSQKNADSRIDPADIADGTIVSNITSDGHMVGEASAAPTLKTASDSDTEAASKVSSNESDKVPSSSVSVATSADQPVLSRKEREHNRKLKFLESRRRKPATMLSKSADGVNDAGGADSSALAADKFAIFSFVRKPKISSDSSAAVNDGRSVDKNNRSALQDGKAQDSSLLDAATSTRARRSGKEKSAARRRITQHEAGRLRPSSPTSLTNSRKKIMADEQASVIVSSSKYLSNMRKPADKLEVLFLRAEALSSHGFAQAALHLSAQLVQQLLQVLTSAASDGAVTAPSVGLEEVLPSPNSLREPTSVTPSNLTLAVLATNDGSSNSSSNGSLQTEASSEPTHLIVAASDLKTQTTSNVVPATHTRRSNKTPRNKSLLSSVSNNAYLMLSKILFLVQVLADEPAYHYDAFLVGVQGLMLARPAAASRALEVRLSSQEQDLLQLMKQRLGESYRNSRLRAELRQLADRMRTGELKSRGAALLPLNLANYLFDQLCIQATKNNGVLRTSPIGNDAVCSSRRSQRQQQVAEIPPAVQEQSDEVLAFEAALAALGQKAAISETDYPLVCEGTRRQRGELALLMVGHYRDNERQLARILDRFLDRDVYSIFRCDQPLGLSSTMGEVRIDEHMMETSYRISRRPTSITTVLEKLFAFHAQTMLPAGMFWRVPVLCESISNGGGLYTMQETTATGSATSAALTANAKRPAFLRQSSLPRCANDANPHAPQPANMLARASIPHCDANCSSYLLCAADALNVDMSCLTPNYKPIIFIVPPCHSPYVSLFISLNCGGMPIDVVLGVRQQQQQQQQPSCSHQYSHPNMQQQQLQIHRPVLHHSVSTPVFYPNLLGTSSSFSSSTNASSSVLTSAAPSPLQQQQQQQQVPHITSGRKNKQKPASIPNQPSDSLAYFMFEFAKTLLAKAGGSPITSIFHVAPNHNNGAMHQRAGGQNPVHRGLQMCAFQVALYALGVNNRVTPNWLQRTYFSHIVWLQSQAIEIGTVAINFLTHTWEGHLTPMEAAHTADLASRSADRELVRAAAHLAQSTLVHATNIARQEMQRALDQCLEQSHEMLEESLLCIEASARAASGSSGAVGVSPEALFDVARRWYDLYQESRRGFPDANEPRREAYPQQQQPHYQPHAAAARVDDDDGQYGSGDDDDAADYHYIDDDASDVYDDERRQNENGQNAVEQHQSFIFEHLRLKSLWNKALPNLRHRYRRRQRTIAHDRPNNNINAVADAYNAWRNMSCSVAATTSRAGGGERSTSPMPIDFALQLGLRASPPAEIEQLAPQDEIADAHREQSAPHGSNRSQWIQPAAVSNVPHALSVGQGLQQPAMPYAVVNVVQPYMQPLPFVQLTSQLPVTMMQAFPSYSQNATLANNQYQQQLCNAVPTVFTQQQPPSFAMLPTIPQRVVLDSRFSPQMPPVQQQQYPPQFNAGSAVPPLLLQRAVGLVQPATTYPVPLPLSSVYAVPQPVYSAANAVNVAAQQQFLAESVVAAHHRFQAAMGNLHAVMGTQPVHSVSRAAALPHFPLQPQQQLQLNAPFVHFSIPPVQPAISQQQRAFFYSCAPMNVATSYSVAANNNFPPAPLAILSMQPNPPQFTRYPGALPLQQQQQQQQQQPIYPMFPPVPTTMAMNMINRFAHLPSLPPPPPHDHPGASPLNMRSGFLPSRMPPMLPPVNDVSQPTAVQAVPNVNNIPSSGSAVQTSFVPRYFTGQDKHLLAAYRVGMVAMETLTSRVFEDRFHLKYHKIKSPFSQEVLWLLEKVVKKLGLNFFPYFIADVLEAVASPFVLFRIAYESALFLAAAEVAGASTAKNNNKAEHFDAAATVRKQFHSAILGQLMCKCMQMFQQCIIQKIHHISQNEYDEFVDTVQWAQMAYYIMPTGHAQFQLLLKVIKGDPSCKRELWGKVTALVAQFHAELTAQEAGQRQPGQQQQYFASSSAMSGAAVAGIRQRFDNRFNSSTGASAGSSADM